MSNKVCDDTDTSGGLIADEISAGYFLRSQLLEIVNTIHYNNTSTVAYYILT